jgi:hypothetical protein
MAAPAFTNIDRPLILTMRFSDQDTNCLSLPAPQSGASGSASGNIAVYRRIQGVYTGKRNGGTVVQFRFNCTVASANGKATVEPGAEKSRQLYSDWH